jgi:redox-sensitive bicupin YhaK (pirin superfamily)
MWVVPDGRGRTPGYEQLEIPDASLRGVLQPVASGMEKHADDAAIRIGNNDAALYAARLAPGESVAVPEAPYVHLFVAAGSVELEGAGVLREGDAVRFTATGGQRVTATDPAEVLVWEMHSGLTDG